jgi:hypothetical protein
MPTPPPLDADEVVCPHCQAGVAQVCRKPNGDRAEAVHVARRRLAAAGGTVKPTKPARKRAPGKSPATAEGRSKGGKAAAQARRRRRAEINARAEQMKADALKAAEEQAAANLADDAIRYDTDRAILRRHVLDAAALATARLVEGLAHTRRPRGFDDEGLPAVKGVEVFRVEKGVRRRVVDADGTPAVEEVVDMVGWWGTSDVERLGKIAAQALVSLRLEEGKPTGITETQGNGGATAEILGEAGVDDLVAWATRNLRPGS